MFITVTTTITTTIIINPMLFSITNYFMLECYYFHLPSKIYYWY